jgi:hypothetical protein
VVLIVLKNRPCICLERLRKTKTSVKLAGLRNRESNLSPLEYETRVVTSSHQVVCTVLYSIFAVTNKMDALASPLLPHPEIPALPLAKNIATKKELFRMGRNTFCQHV